MIKRKTNYNAHKPKHAASSVDFKRAKPKTPKSAKTKNPPQIQPMRISPPRATQSTRSTLFEPQIRTTPQRRAGAPTKRPSSSMFQTGVPMSRGNATSSRRNAQSTNPVKRANLAPRTRQTPKAPPATKRRRNGSPALIYTFLSLSAVAVLAVLSLTVFFRADDVIIDGITPYSSTEILLAANINVGDNIFTANVNPDTVSSALPHIRNIEISRRIFPSKIVLRVQAAESTYKVLYQDDYIILDDRFQVLRIVNAGDIEQEDFNGIELVGVKIKNPTPGEVISFSEEESSETLDRLVKILQNDGLDGINLIDVADAANINMIYRDRIFLQLGTLAEMNYKLRFANEIIANELTATTSGRLDLTRLSSGGNEIHFSPGTLQQLMGNGNELNHNPSEESHDNNYTANAENNE